MRRLSLLRPSYLYAGNILQVDLTHNQATIIPTARYARSVIGGRGIDIRLLYERVGATTDPLVILR